MIPHISLWRVGAGEGEGQVRRNGKCIKARRMGRGRGRGRHKGGVDQARWSGDEKDCQHENCY